MSHCGLNSAIRDYVKLVEVTTDSFTLEEGVGVQKKISIPSVAGYKYFATISTTPNGDAGVICYPNGWTHNTKPKTVTITVTHTLLFIRDI